MSVKQLTQRKNSKDDGYTIVHDALMSLSASSSIEERGAIYTRNEVVEFILDLIGYTEDKPLFKMRLLEPSIGSGDFFIPCIRRLLNSWKRFGGGRCDSYNELSAALLGVEIHTSTMAAAKNKAAEVLIEFGFSSDEAGQLASSWIANDDFLMAEIPNKFHFVVGNPPYVRQELIPAPLLSEYRKRYHTIYDRADLYIPFIERSLALLTEDGQLGFICSDRWMKNKYGGPLRKFVADHFHLKFYVDMVDTPAFHSDVIAYPAVVVFDRKRTKITRIAHRPKINSLDLTSLATALNNKNISENDILELTGIAVESEPWILESLDQLAIVRKLESRFPLLEEVGCKVGIGVATGSDKAFIGKYNELDVESSRKIKLVTTNDILDGNVAWQGLGVINPFNTDGSLVNLDDFPRLKKYLYQRKDIILKRHVALKNPNSWYRTIDKITPSLAKKQKLLIPDIKGRAHVVLEDGKLYPHHNLYYIISETWELSALQAVLQSGIARLFVSIYSTKMRGGYMRFQAQYLRRIRLPRWEDVPVNVKNELLDAANKKDVQACNAAVFKLYGLTVSEQQAIGGNGE